MHSDAFIVINIYSYKTNLQNYGHICDICAYILVEMYSEERLQMLRRLQYYPHQNEHLSSTLLHLYYSTISSVFVVRRNMFCEMVFFVGVKIENMCSWLGGSITGNFHFVRRFRKTFAVHSHD